MLCRLLYVSRISPEAGSRIAGTMEDILVVSARRNRADAITGFLLADGESFVQVLEGPEARVIACYERIATDGRNCDARLRLLTPIDHRRFPRWSMCGLRLSEADDTLLSPSDIRFDLVDAEAGALLQHLEGIALRHASQLDAAHERIASAS
ncbi:MAG: BLUF domain-containing protein [Phenylobacterium sp.]|uniref:BLUF domain-containing protein n=1 Tax=Phenylobacterium sp. TaxID=1871053 RepID=UPI0012020542|nr:BLUF domain-containing protein [Phenylobacterium sp.]TAJ71957.1 MAG: BLUF domain-containing protein [Phenylobacterium sp.]